MRKFLLTALIVMVSACMLFAGGSKEKASTSADGSLSGTLTIWSMLTQTERATELENLAREFEAQNPGVTVEISVMPWSGALDKLMASIMAGNPPDISIVGQGYPQTLSESGGLMELSDFIDSIGGPDQFLGSSLSVLSAGMDGGTYAVPLYITPVVAYYRQSYLDEAGWTGGLPETWEEYYEMCKAVTDPAKNRYGFGVPLGDNHGTKTLWCFLQANGVDLVNVDEDGNWYVDIDDEDYAAMVETYEYLYKLVRDCSPEGITSYTQANVRELVGQGTIMSRIDTPEIYYNVQALDPDNLDDVKYFKVPANKEEAYYMGYVGWAVPTAGNTDLALEFLRFCYSGDTLSRFYASYPYAMFPPMEGLFHSESYQTSLPAELQPMVPDLALDILSKSNAIALANGPFPYAGEIEQTTLLGSPLVRMLTEGISAEEAVDQVIEDLNGLFE